MMKKQTFFYGYFQRQNIKNPLVKKLMSGFFVSHLIIYPISWS